MADQAGRAGGSVVPPGRRAAQRPRPAEPASAGLSGRPGHRLFQLGLLKAESDLASGERELAPLLAEQEKLVTAYPAVPDYRNALGRDLLEYGKLLLRRDQPARALPMIEQGVARFEEALKEDPGNRNYGKNLTEALTVQLMIAVKGKQTERVAALAERLVEARTADLKAYLTASMGLTRCVVITSSDESLAPDVREARANAYGRRAVEILRSVVDRGLLHAPTRSATRSSSRSAPARISSTSSRN